jgi:RimJ/RimL family protein N-acetyltransferase
MRSGEMVADFLVKDARRVILRTPKWEDLDDLLELINSLVEEKAEIVVSDKVTRKEEADWLANLLSRLETDQTFFLVAEVDGKVVASSDLHAGKGTEAHSGTVGIVIRKGFRGLGIGTRMMRAILEVAGKRGFRVLVLSVFATNKRAIHVYEKVGFVECGRVLGKHFHRGKYVDEVIMSASLR